MNKYLLMIVLALIFTLGCTSLTYAGSHSNSGFFWFSGGGKNGNGNFAVGFGGDNLGVEFGLIDDANLPEGTLDYECPHWDFTSIGNRTLKSTTGIDLLGMFHLSQHVILYGGPGIYWSHRGEVVRSNATGWYYTETDHTYTEIACSGGLRFILTDNSGLGIGYHSLRGTNLTFQFSF